VRMTRKNGPGRAYGFGSQHAVCETSKSKRLPTMAHLGCTKLYKGARGGLRGRRFALARECSHLRVGDPSAGSGQVMGHPILWRRLDVGLPPEW
jgi:hypothetical protein